MRAKTILALLSLAAPAVAGDIPLAPPIDCTLGETCFIQNYVDRDPGPGAADFACGGLTYDGHKGTDFALPTEADMARGVSVLSVAPGTVKATRDGMPDIAMDRPGAPALDGRDCGNGVVVSHGEGWETQYCHLREGSVAVRKGMRVAKGTVLGQVGLSGRTEFPHVHLSVRRDGRVVDPFDPASGPATCGRAAAAPLWQNPLPYAPGGLVGAGFSTTVPGFDAVKAGLASPATLPAGAPALVLWAHAFGGRAGDAVAFEIDGPGGARIFEHRATLDRAQVRFFRAAGRRPPAGGWPDGAYRGTAQLMRGDEVLGQRTVTLRIGG
ncbi:M23 family metallopeptidase [Rhodovulum iodosum]|nr:M23 family metallopeptidase [Rhodovulum robiginosum]RSK30736.1 M23 family metallopeptidase [Rhodovulum robiginosum]